MASQSGTHLGPYEIVSAIGARGMGEVYRARDPKLGRDVPIRVLPREFAGDSEHMVRLQCEAKILAFQSIFCFRPELVLPRLLGSDQIDADYWPIGTAYTDRGMHP
jgi:hypothetical protein